MSIINEINGLLYDRLIWIGLKFSSIIYNIKKIKTIHRASRTIWFLLYLIQIVFGQSVSIKTSSIRASKSPFSSPSSLAVATTISVSSIESTTKTLTTTKTLSNKYLNQRCDFERIPSRGCHLRESYCSMHRCVCKPDFPINIADRLCLSRLKTVGESCQISQECQEGSLCSTRNNLKVCHCKSGLVYSKKSKQCLKGLRGSSCSENSDCHGENMFCSFVNCECKYGYQWFPEEESCLKRSKLTMSLANVILIRNVAFADNFFHANIPSMRSHVDVLAVRSNGTIDRQTLVNRKEPPYNTVF
ncbi:Propionyl-CoA carboxylase alpha chain [Sarcoptes scabiei]|nr:Propionyl-CoA carboxylase alpha chain [Sarcoptes scabiei]